MTLLLAKARSAIEVKAIIVNYLASNSRSPTFFVNLQIVFACLEKVGDLGIYRFLPDIA
jgi:hypothetical protein